MKDSYYYSKEMADLRRQLKELDFKIEKPSPKKRTPEDICVAILAKAIRNRKIAKADNFLCHRCGYQADHWHHTNGYRVENAICITPLCASCHRWTHGQIKRGVIDR